MRAFIVGIVAFGVATAPTAAKAADSTGSVAVRIVIPPLAAAFAAQREGAVGMWTVRDAHSGLMINLPDATYDQEDVHAAIYHSPEVVFRVSVEASSGTTVSSRRAASFRGLKQESLILRTSAPVRRGAADQGPQRSTMMLITGV